VDEFLIDPDSGSITHLCLRKDHIFGDRAVCIPVSEIGTIEETVVHLSIDKEALAALPSVPVQRAW
jgi:hypothetical protein